MGMSASQARLLSITARLSDNELQVESISNTKIRLSNATSAASQKYLDALQNTTTTVQTLDSDATMQLEEITTELLQSSGFRIQNKDGVIAGDGSDEGQTLYEFIQNNPTYLSNGLKNGELFLQQAAIQQDGSIQWSMVSVSSTAEVVEVPDTAALAYAEAEYTAEMDKLNQKEKILDLDLNRLQTEHNALQTEYDSVKKVIEKNIERSFKTFSG